MSVNTKKTKDIIVNTNKEVKMKSKKNNINGKKQDIQNDTILNPFFTGIDGGSVLSLQFRDLYMNYKDMYIMCLRDNIIITDDTRNSIMNIYLKIVKKSTFVESYKHFCLIKAPSSLLRNFSLRKRANLIQGSVLQEIYPLLEGDKYDIDNIVAPVFELTESTAQSYIQMYSGDTNIKKLTNALSFVLYYNRFNGDIFNEKIQILIKTIDVLCYWKNPNNCKFNMNDMFNRRSLSYNGHRLDQIRYATISGAKTLNNLLTHLEKKKTGIKIDDDDYLAGMKDDVKTYTKAEHMNIYQVLRESDNRKFFATIDEGQFGFTKNDVADLFDRITNEQYRFHLLNTMLVSKDLCHFIINNKRVLVRNADLFEKYKPLYAYLLGYAWITLYLEESIFSTKTTKNHRFVFDIDTAHELPMFPFSMENLHNNPYVSLLLNRDLIDPKTNCMSIDALEDYKKYYGVCTNEEALKRFNSFVSGKHDINIFTDLDPKIFAISGSIIPACLQRHSPLIDQCVSNTIPFDDIYGTYYNHYYGESDIDVMCGVNTMAEFFHHASKFLDTLIKNLNCQRSDLQIKPNKKMAVVISKHFFKECVYDLNNELETEYTPDSLIKIFEQSLSSNDESINNLPKNIINYFYVDYVHEKNESIKKWRAVQKINNIEFDDELLASFNTITSPECMAIKMVSYDITEDDTNKRDSEVYYYVNDFRDEHNQVAKDKNYIVFKFSESIKYKISSNKLKRDVEIFKVDPYDPFHTVAKFHKPCVRCYIQGGKFYMLPSFITAMMTMVNIDYKYFAGSRDPIEIINKYRMRGYSVILNANEKKSIMMYNKYIGTSNGMFKIIEESEAFGPKDLNNKIFKPIVFKLGIPDGIYAISKHKYIKNESDLKKIYEHECKLNLTNAPINLLNYTSISKSGNVAPVQMWVADAFYEYVNKEK
jgi:hypothetical protein